ncbi:MAG: efflux RND transporter permease subunit [Vicingaceae bacterium]
MDASFFPVQDPKRINVSVFYPGASPKEMEEGVTVKVEQALKGISGIEEIYSTSSENISSINIVCYDDADLDEVIRDVENAVDGINSLPAGAEKPSIVKQRSFMNSRAAFIALSGNVSLDKLKETSEEIENDLLNTDAISQVILLGFPNREFSIEVNEEQLLRYNLTFDQVANAVRLNNIDISGGSVKTDDEEYLIRARSKENTIEGIENIVVRTTPQGDIIHLRDIADVKFQFAESPLKSYIDGKRTVTIQVMKLEEEDLGDISEAVNKYVKEFNEKHSDMQLTTVFQFYDLVQERIQLLSKNGLMGLILVLVVLGLFLNLRLSIWVAAGIPISFLGMFIFGYFYGMTINLISLFGMILVVGILVDDGIVIAENIYAHYEKGKPPFKAALDGTVEVLPSVFTSILTTVTAFSVLLFIEGMEQMAEMAFAVIVCLLFSMIEAFFVLPSHLNNKKIAKKPKQTYFSKIKKAVENFIEYLRDKIYADVLKLVVYKKRLRRALFFLPLLFVILIAVLLSKGVIKSTFFPAIPFDDFNVEIAYKPGETAEKTEDYLWYCYDRVVEVKKELEKQYNDTFITYVTLTVGSTEELGESGSHAGMLRVSLDVEGAPISSFAIAKMVEDRIKKDPNLEKIKIGGGNRWGKPVAVALRGDDYEKIKEAKEYFKNELMKMPELKDISDDGGNGSREILLQLKPKARILGLTHADITKQIRQGFFGEELQRLIIGTEEVRVWVRYPEKDRKSLGQLDEVMIKTPNGETYPLYELADYEIKRGEFGIKHFDGVREIEVEAALVDDYASTSDINKKIADNIVPKIKANFPMVDVEFRGQVREAEKSGISMGIITMILIILMLLILSLNFNSVWQGLMFFLIIFIGPFCAILGHGIEHIPFSLLSIWGVIALMGILVNDAIVYLDKYNDYILQGMHPHEAVFNAGIHRFRAILLTSITTVAGLYPLIGEQSFQAQFLIPMAVSVAYGVLFGTIIILVFFPVLILSFNDIRRAFKWLWTGKKPSVYEVEPALINKKRKEENNKNIESETVLAI